MKEDIWCTLYNEAKRVQKSRTVSPFIEAGGVASAILTKAGNIYVGVCIDTASALGMCAERNAIANMITNGEHQIDKVVAVVEDGSVGSPCGACREYMMQLDKRFEFLQQILEIDCEDVVDAEFIMNENGEYYNLEYFKCIIIDICISAIKYASDRSDYLLRVDYFLYIKKALQEDPEFWEGKEPMQCQVEIFREASNVPGVDYLVLRNPVDKFTHELYDWKEQNKAIQRRLTDPLDFIDGHMSLLAIKRYIENLDKALGTKCVFQYVEAENDMWKLFFETKLPVLKEKKYGENGILD